MEVRRLGGLGTGLGDGSGNTRVYSSGAVAAGGGVWYVIEMDLLCP